MFIFHKLYSQSTKQFSRYSKKVIDRRTVKKFQNTKVIPSHKTLCNNFQNGGVKYVDTSSKFISLQCSWLQKLCDKNFHEWKIIRPHLLNKYFRKSLKFHLCHSFDHELVIKFPEFYKNILFQWSCCFLLFPKYLFAFCQIFYGLINTFHLKKSIFFRYFSDRVFCTILKSAHEMVNSFLLDSSLIPNSLATPLPANLVFKNLFQFYKRKVPCRIMKMSK